MQWYPNVLFWAENPPPSPPQGNLYQVDSNNRWYCQILGLLSVELKFESLFEIQFSETQQTNQRATRPCQNGEQRTQSMPNAPGILEERRA